MAGSVSSSVKTFLELNDSYITNPLFENQKTPWVGTVSACAQILASTVSIVATGIFALLTTTLGFVCKVVGLKETGEDLLQSAQIVFFGEGPGCRGTIGHLVMLTVSLFNAISVTTFFQWADRLSNSMSQENEEINEEIKENLEVLELDPTQSYTKETVRKQYLTVARKYHPDKVSGTQEQKEAAIVKFQQIAAANTRLIELGFFNDSL